MSTEMRREVAKRVFAGEFRDAGHTFKESEEERAPTYLLLPTGEKANRVFAVGTLTEKDDIGSDSEYWRARVVDPTGTFLVYAGQYQPEAVDVIRDVQPPEYVAVVGKPDTYEPDDSDDVITSVRPESMTVVDADTRDRWIAETAERTLERIKDGELSGRAGEVYGERDYRRVVTEALENLE
ncbi:MAG: RPA family protein [Methanobacteriota archaeon]|jgi:RPA family protein|uniref:DNA-binding protein n=1 Tax=Halorutilus salinus TaxID=2487751 RepID=A0A9Q4C5K9_9EURY|nr:DNA-binding protein [Halorutilus salinus]MCX2819535.1 DNA-binding protein [Halorutilus salinus]